MTVSDCGARADPDAPVGHVAYITHTAHTRMFMSRGRGFRPEEAWRAIQSIEIAKGALCKDFLSCPRTPHDRRVRSCFRVLSAMDSSPSGDYFIYGFFTIAFLTSCLKQDM